MSYYIHQIPGRLRIKSPAVKRNPAKAEIVEGLLKSIDGVDSVAVNILTGSITIHYDQNNLQPEAILDRLKQARYFDESKAVTHDQVIYTAASNVGLFLGKTVCGAVVETALGDSAFSMLAALI
ncbi:MAG: heavy-metal-associated domain-containing protein [Nitrospirae bacterium]|nr:heavy-metal-associated domain-containing protein [Candidatus Manganitrophaceae bacterium]